MKKGIDAADNTGKFDVATSGFLFSAHFYNPRLNRGGWWDPKPEINALNYGKDYFQRSINDDSAESSGRSLGLAIHYLQDLCQPMHCGLYPNLPGDTLIALRTKTTSSGSSITRHRTASTFESSIWTCFGSATSENGGNSLRHVESPNSTHGSTRGYPRSSGEVYGLTALTAEQMSHAKHDNWLPTLSRMLKLAQRLTAGLMLAWADAPSKLVTNENDLPGRSVADR